MENKDLRDAAFDSIYNIIQKDKNTIFLTADQGAYSLTKLQKDFPSQYYNIGISEQTMINVAAGLTKEGKRVFIHAITPFLIERSYEQIKLNLSCMRLPICLVAIGGGFVYNGDGPSHHSINDISILRSLPNIILFSPSDSSSVEWSIEQARFSNDPSYIRLDKGFYPDIHSKENLNTGPGFSLVRSYGHDVLFIGTGTIIHNVISVADDLKKIGVNTSVIDLYLLKYYNKEDLSNIFKRFDVLVSIEEHSVIGGIGSIVEEILSTNVSRTSIFKKIGINDYFCRYSGDREWMRKFFGIDEDSIKNTVMQYFKR